MKKGLLTFSISKGGHNKKPKGQKERDLTNLEYTRDGDRIRIFHPFTTTQEIEKKGLYKIEPSYDPEKMTLFLELNQEKGTTLKNTPNPDGTRDDKNTYYDPPKTLREFLNQEFDLSKRPKLKIEKNKNIYSIDLTEYKK